MMLIEKQSVKIADLQYSEFKVEVGRLDLK